MALFLKPKKEVLAGCEPPAEIPSGARDLLLNAGTKLDSYEIIGAIGVGGMGEVEAHWRRPFPEKMSRQPKSRARARDLSC
jgi:hypothetical protein